MKIKIIFSFLSAIFFTLGMLFVSTDGRLGEVLGDTTLATIEDNAVASSGTSAHTVSSETVTLAPLTPPSLQAVVSGATSAKLHWTRPGNASGAVAYKVNRNGTAIKTFTDALSYEDAGLNPGSEYGYSVWAKDSLGRMIQTPSVSIMLPKPVSTTGNTVSESTTSASDLKISYPVHDRPTDTSASTTNTATTSTATADKNKIQPSIVIRPESASADATKTLLSEREVRSADMSGGVTLSDRDSDGDGLPDAEEVRIGSDPFGTDSDSDGFPDGAEVKNGFNPLKSAVSDRGDKVVFESPKEKRISKAAVEDKRLRVEKVERVARDDGQAATKISGKGTPNSFLTIYIYSDPIVVTVKTDSDGNWSYELDRDLEDGNHEVYVAVTDATGRISAQSSPIPFVKTAEAISVVPVSDVESETRGNRSPVERAGEQFIFFGIAIMIMFLLGTFYFIGHRAFSN